MSGCLVRGSLTADAVLPSLQLETPPSQRELPRAEEKNRILSGTLARTTSIIVEPTTSRARTSLLAMQWKKNLRRHARLAPGAVLVGCRHKSPASRAGCLESTARVCLASWRNWAYGMV